MIDAQWKQSECHVYLNDSDECLSDGPLTVLLAIAHYYYLHKIPIGIVCPRLNHAMINRDFLYGI